MVWNAGTDPREGQGGDRPLDGCWLKNRDARPIKSRFYQSQNAPKLAFLSSKNQNIFWGGGTAQPLPRPLPRWGGTPPPHTPTPSPPLAPPSLRVRRSTRPQRLHLPLATPSGSAPGGMWTLSTWNRVNWYHTYMSMQAAHFTTGNICIVNSAFDHHCYDYMQTHTKWTSIHWLMLFVAEVVGPYNNFQGGQPSWSDQEKCVLLSYYLNFRVWESANCMDNRFFVCSKGYL